MPPLRGETVTYKCLICGGVCKNFTELYDPARTLTGRDKWVTIWLCDDHQAEFIKAIRLDLYRMKHKEDE